MAEQAIMNRNPLPSEVANAFDRYAAARQAQLERTMSGMQNAASGRSFVGYDAINDTVVAVEWVTEQSQERPRRQSATAVLERPAGMPVVLPPNLPPADYLEAAAAIGLDAPKVLSARVHYWLSTHGWPVYDYERVMRYLHQLASREQPPASMDAWGGRAEVVPFWAPLRTVDRCETFQKPGDFRSMGSTKAGVYDRAVPKHALAKVQELERPENFGPGVLRFAVSDYAAVNPDPFLLCLAGGTRFVIDVWDEPGW